MSKIICDVCGTSYPETATQCPICGCVRNVGSSVAEDSEGVQTRNGGYTYVKGGRFSKSNVKKRAKTNQSGNRESAPTQRKKDVFDNKQKSNTGAVVAIMIALLAVVAVLLFIAVKFFIQNIPGVSDETKPSDTGTTQTPSQIACESLSLDDREIELTVGQGTLLEVTRMPEGCTDEITYASSDEAVATVSNKGMVEAVGAGRAEITIDCGEQSITCVIICEGAPETSTAPSESTGSKTFTLLEESVTFTRKGEIRGIYDSTVNEIPAEDIEWTSADETVATVDSGVISAVGDGETTVYARYDGQELTCAVTCTLENTQGGIGGSGGISEDDGGASVDDGGESSGTSGSCRIVNITGYDNSEASVYAGKSFILKLVDENGNIVNAEWSVYDSSICTVDDSTEMDEGYVTVTGVSGGGVSTVVYAKYDGNTYKFTVIVW